MESFGLSQTMQRFGTGNPVCPGNGCENDVCAFPCISEGRKTANLQFNLTQEVLYTQ